MRHRGALMLLWTLLVFSSPAAAEPAKPPIRGLVSMGAYKNDQTCAPLGHGWGTVQPAPYGNENSAVVIHWVSGRSLQRREVRQGGGERARQRRKSFQSRVAGALELDGAGPHRSSGES